MPTRKETKRFIQLFIVNESCGYVGKNVVLADKFDGVFPPRCCGYREFEQETKNGERIKNSKKSFKAFHPVGKRTKLLSREDFEEKISRALSNECSHMIRYNGKWYSISI